MYLAGLRIRRSEYSQKMWERGESRIVVSADVGPSPCWSRIDGILGRSSWVSFASNASCDNMRNIPKGDDQRLSAHSVLGDISQKWQSDYNVKVVFVKYWQSARGHRVAIFMFLAKACFLPSFFVGNLPTDGHHMATKVVDKNKKRRNQLLANAPAVVQSHCTLEPDSIQYPADTIQFLKHCCLVADVWLNPNL